MNLAIHNRIVVCHKCDVLGGPNDGRVCGVDNREPSAHASAGYCPHPDGPRFGSGDKPEGWEGGDRDALPRPAPRDPLDRHFARFDLSHVGEHVERALSLFGADKLAAWYERVTGKSCGCESRKERLNAIGRAVASRIGL